MKLAVSMYSLNNSFRRGETNIEDFISFCGMLRIQGVEFPSYYWKDRKAETKKVPNLLRKNNLVLVAYGTSNNFICKDKLERKEQVRHVKQEIGTAAELGAPLMRIFAGSLPEGKLKEDAMDMVTECLKECVDCAKNAGTILALENHGGITGTSQEVKRILDSIDSSFLRAIVDIGNFIESGQDPEEAIEELMPYAAHVHLKDAKTEESDWSDCILGEGDIDIEAALGLLVRSGYNEFLSLEQDVSGVDEKQGIRKSMDYAKGILRGLTS